MREGTPAPEGLVAEQQLWTKKKKETFRNTRTFSDSSKKHKFRTRLRSAGRAIYRDFTASESTRLFSFCYPDHPVNNIYVFITHTRTRARAPAQCSPVSFIHCRRVQIKKKKKLLRGGNFPDGIPSYSAAIVCIAGTLSVIPPFPPPTTTTTTATTLPSATERSFYDWRRRHIVNVQLCKCITENPT